MKNNVNNKALHNIILKAFLNLPVSLSIVVLLSVLFGESISIDIKRFFYSISLSLKDLLVFFVPYIIFALASSSILNLGRKASLLVGILLFSVILSNFFSTFIAYMISLIFLKSGQYITLDKIHFIDSLKPLWNLALPQIITNEQSLLIGLIFGIAGTYFKLPLIEKVSETMTQVVTFFLNKIFIPVIPLFVSGFIFKLGHEGLLTQISKSYLPVFLIIATVQVSYVLFLYGLASHFKLPRFITYLKNTFPSAMTAFCTMSSVATMPLTLQGAEKNTDNKNLARVIIPGTANIHLIGDSIGVPIMAIAIMLSFGYDFPSTYIYMIFAAQFVFAKFCIAAVPGGGIIVMVPVIEACLGFSPEMSALVTAFYIFFDPINTTMNVTGNGVFAILMNKLGERLSRRQRPNIIPVYK